VNKPSLLEGFLFEKKRFAWEMSLGDSSRGEEPRWF